ncbi:cytochrome P450 78A3 [Thelonectria olida]|uniref:Cytochrome P450 78A3 n=1 Tax=Thelonectria olida TaxID=1576542 RepID=A0A9P8VXR9_9HYPO|nr:cytochrome P450 78A3 [Thelonectria olida]
MAQTIIFPVAVLITALTHLLLRHLDYQHFVALSASLATVSFFYFVVWRSWIYSYYISKLRHVPTVKGFPRWGQILDFITQECGVPQRRWCQNHGPVIRYFFPLGAERLYPKPLRAKLWMMRILGEGVLLAEGEEHMHQRKTLAPGFSTQSIKALESVFWGKSLLLANSWLEMMRADNVKTKPFEVLEWLNRTTLDIIGKAGFGDEINSLEQPDVPIREAYHLVFAFDLWSNVLRGLHSFIPISKYIPAKMNRDLDTPRRIIISKANKIIRKGQQGAEQNTSGRDIIALIAKTNKRLLDEGEKGLTFEAMRDQIMTFLGAGHDTTATGVAWTLHLLSAHPDIQSRLREEIREYLPFLSGSTARPDIVELATASADQLPYLNNVCRESLRYIPPIPMTVRESIADDTLAGYKVPTGTIVYILSNAINRLPIFDPDRWNHLPQTWTQNGSTTFLQGPRGCIGRKFAETEMKILLCSLLSIFDF